MNSDGSDQKRLTALNHGISYSYATFSPDGDKILYIMSYPNADEKNTWSHIYIMDINGDHPTRLSDIDDYHLAPFFNTSGDKIIFSTFIDGSYKIMMMDTNGSRIVRLSKDNYSNHSATFYNSNSD
jgi:Tol biopolymer transport system component